MAIVGAARGFVVGISLSDPRTIKSWATRARGGGIWAPGGISTDGTSLFVATGNTFGARTWSDGEAVMRLTADLHRSDNKRDFFAPSDWEALDARDADLGGSNPIPLEGSGGGPPLILALGKDRKAYLLDRNNLGGIGGQLAMETVSERSIITAPVTYPAADGIFVALQAEGTHCPTQAPGTSHPENPARFAIGHYDSLVRISTWQRCSDSDHDRWTLERHRVDSWRRRRQSASRVQSGHW